jgi:hypothetical protein
MLWPCRPTQGHGMVRAWHGNGMASVNQTRPHCVNQLGKTHSKRLAARHGRGTAWAQHAMCESVCKDLLHLPAECTGHSNSRTDRKIFKRCFFHTAFPRWQNISARLACLKTANSDRLLITAPHTLVNLNSSREIFLFVSFLQILHPVHNLWTKESNKIGSVVIDEFSFASVWITNEH